MRKVNKFKKYSLRLLLSPWYLIYGIGSLFFLTAERSKRLALKIDRKLESHENAKI